MKKLRNWATALLFVLATGCAQLGIQPQTHTDKVAVAVVTVTQVRSTTAMLLRGAKISSKDAENVLKQTDTADEAIALSMIIAKTDPGGGSNKLLAAVNILAEVQRYLLTKEKL